MKKSILILVSIAAAGNLYAMNIDDAIQKALLNNNSLKKQQYMYEEAKENINYAKGSYKPVATLGYNYNSRSENLDGNGKDYSYGNATITYNLFNGFTDKYNIEATKNSAEYSLFTLQSAKHDLILTTKQNYISYLKSLKNIDTQENAYKLLEQQFRDSENRFEQGLLAKNDLLQVNAQMLQAKQNLQRAKADSRISRFQLKNTLGGILSADETIEDLKKQETLENEYNIEELNSRNEIKALKKSIDAILSQKKANSGDFMPSADLSLSYIKYGDDAFLEVDEDDTDEQTTATVSLSWNLYNGGRDSSEDIMFNKKILQVKEDLANLKLSIKLQYENALEEFEVSKLNYETAKISLAQSQENYKIVNNRFKEGLSSSTDLINANFLLSQAKQSFDSAYYDRFLAKASLDRIFEKENK